MIKVNIIERYKIKEGEIKNKDETCKIYKGYYFIFKNKFEIIIAFCQNGRYLFNTVSVKNDKQSGRLFRIFIFLFGRNSIK